MRCTGRADIVGVADDDDDTEPAAWTVVRGVGRRVRDARAAAIEQRLAIAAKEWETWTLCREVSVLQTRLGALGGGVSDGMREEKERKLPIEAELRVWAPREYDREITEGEWAATPEEVREVWQARAEALSFAVLRRCGVEDGCMEEAMRMMKTEERLVLGMRELERAKKLTLARLSIIGALGGDDAGKGGTT